MPEEADGDDDAAVCDGEVDVAVDGEVDVAVDEEVPAVVWAVDGDADADAWEVTSTTAPAASTAVRIRAVRSPRLRRSSGRDFGDDTGSSSNG